MVAGLLPGLDLPQLHSGVSGGAVEHGCELLLCGEVGAGAGGEKTAPGQQLHGPVVDLLIPGDGVGNGPAGLGEGRRVQDDEVVPLRLLLQRGQQVEHVGGHAVHCAGEAVARRVGPGHLHGGLRHIHGGDVLRPAHRGVQSEGSGVGEAVQHRPAPGDAPHRPAVVLLVQEEPGLLAVLHVYQIFHAVLRDLRHCRIRRRFPRQGIPPLALGQPLLLPQGHVVPEKDPADREPVRPEELRQRRQQDVLDPLHAHGQHLDGQQVVELVHRQSGKGICLPEDDPAGVQVLRRHHALPVFPGPLKLPAPEGGVELVIGVAGHQPHPDLGLFRQKARTQIPALFADHVHQAAVFRLSLCGCNFCVIDPGMAPEDGGLRFGRDGVSGVIPFRFHGMIPFPLIFPGQCITFLRETP